MSEPSAAKGSGIAAADLEVGGTSRHRHTLWEELAEAAWPADLPLPAQTLPRVRADVGEYLRMQLRRASWPIRVPVRCALPLIWLSLKAGGLFGVSRRRTLASFAAAFGAASGAVVRVLRSLVYFAAFEHEATRAAMGLEAFTLRQRQHRARREALLGDAAGGAQ